MVQPQGDIDFNKGKKEFRRSMKKREKVDLYKIRKQRMLQQKQEDEQEEEEEKIDGIQNHNSEERLLFRTTDSNSNVSDKSESEGPVHHNSEGNLRRFSRIIDAPQSIIEYKDLIKSISLQLFSKSNSSTGVNKNSSSPRSAKYTSFGTGDETLDRTFDSADEDFRTRNFVLTQKFIGWKV